MKISSLHPRLLTVPSRPLLATALVCSLSMISLHAAPISWTGTTGNWSDSTWTGGVPPDAQNAEAVITAAGSVVDLQSTSRTVGSLLIGNTTAVTLNSTGGGNLIFNSSVGNATLAQAAGVNNNTAINAGLTLNSSLDVTANASGSTRHLDLNGKITGSGSLNIKSAVGKVQLNNSTNDFSGGVTIENGASLQVLSAGAYLGTGNFTINGGSIQTAGSGTLNIGGGGTQIWNGNFTTSLGASSLNMGTKAVDLNGGIRTVTITATSNNRTNTVGGVISNGGLVVSHTGSTASLVLTGANTYAGGTTVNTTAILATSATGTFGVGSITVADLATLTLGNNMSIGDTAGLTFGNSTINLNYTGTETVSSLFSSVTSTSMANGIGYTATDLNNFFGGSFFTGTGLITVASVPEPSTYAALLGAFVLGGAVIVRRRRAAGSRL